MKKPCRERVRQGEENQQEENRDLDVSWSG
jgi:hypothetical protein